MRRHIPNLITISRLALTIAFFALLNVHQSSTFSRAMWIAFFVFLVATLTDMLDGYLARAWHAESAFGRVVDPFVDKILVCGAFIFFSSTDFINIELLSKDRNVSITGVEPWMAVVLIAREFLITGLRGLAEARGIPFPADWAGKIKMVIQSIAVGAIIVHVATAYQDGHLHPVPWIQTLTVVSVWLTLAVTVLSATGYILRAHRIFTEDKGTEV